jgi:glycosyltransferase involved in cell wall biosynthesis
MTQRFPQEQFEVIMVDNNSRDGSVEIVKQFSRIKLISEKKQGSYAARNKGLLMAKGAIVAFTDADCCPDPDWLASIEQAMQDQGTNIVLGKRNYASGSLLLQLLGAYETEKIRQICAGYDHAAYYGYTNNMAARRILFDLCGCFLEIPRGADSLFVRTVVDRFGCKGVRFDNQVCIRHLEMNTIRDYYRKRIIYGQSYEKYRKIRNARSLSNYERFQIFRTLTISQGCSSRDSLCLAVLLFIGLIHFDFGRQLTRLSTTGTNFKRLVIGDRK